MARLQAATPGTEFEEAFWHRGELVAGIDEAGRGALAGPVVAAAVILPLHCNQLPSVRDSKILTALQRNEIFVDIKQHALSIGVGVVECDVIDRINILQATFQAMHIAVQSLNVHPSHLLIDGNRFIQCGVPYTTIIDGDALCLSIAAASIVAKVTRDAIMDELHEEFPAYGFAKHKGYATECHRSAILSHGDCPQHRQHFLRKLRAHQIQRVQ